MDINENHIGCKAWRRLTHRQRKAIIRNRDNARKIYDGFLNEKMKRLYPSKYESKSYTNV